MFFLPFPGLYDLPDVDDTEPPEPTVSPPTQKHRGIKEDRRNKSLCMTRYLPIFLVCAIVVLCTLAGVGLGYGIGYDNGLNAKGKLRYLLAFSSIAKLFL